MSLKFNPSYKGDITKTELSVFSVGTIKDGVAQLIVSVRVTAVQGKPKHTKDCITDSKHSALQTN